jgi:hypothetical protein
MSQELASILAKGDVKACLKLFAKLSENERQAMAKDVQALAQPIIDKPFIDLKDGGFKSNPLVPAAGTAALAACSISQIKKIWRRRWHHLPADDVVVAVFSARKPAWLDEWVAWACERNIGHWSIIRPLIRAGLSSKPESDNYTLGMITTVCPYYERKRTIYSAVLDDPELLREDIWRLFEVEGNTGSSLAGRDKYQKGPENTWSYALLRLVKERKLPRKRLLDASLDALARDFGTFQAGWFSRFHEALDPTLKERAVRFQEYTSLLASRIAPTVSFALKALLLLTKNDLVEPKALLASITPALANRHKGTVQSALQLLDQVGKRNPKLHSQIDAVLAEALLHASPDVHKKALDLLARSNEPIGADLAQVLRERMDHVAASQRARLLALLSSLSPVPQAKDDAAPDLDEKELRRRAAALDPKWRKLAGVDRLIAFLDSGQGELAGIDFDPMEIPRLDPCTRLAPIETVDELIDVCAHVLENPDNTKSAEELHWALWIWPMQREAWFGAWAQTYADNLDWWEAAWGNRVFLEPLLDPDVPLGAMARLMLGLGLAAKEPGESSLATDALIAAIDDARFDSDRFGETLAFLAPLLKAARLARTFSRAARVSPLHRHLIGRAAQASLRGNPGAAPRDLSALLEFLKESLVEGGEGVTDPDARKYLQKIKATGKTARLVRDLLELANNPGPVKEKHVLLQALRNRIQRAESWNNKQK